MLLKQVHREKIESMKELQQRITEEWKRLAQSVIDNSVKQWHISASVLVLLQMADILNICCECCINVAFNAEFYCLCSKMLYLLTVLSRMPSCVTSFRSLAGSIWSPFMYSSTFRFTLLAFSLQ